MNSLQNKMYNYEVIPPKNAWEKIAGALDEANLADEFPSKLNSLEVAPPPSAWAKIASSLDTEQGVVIPMKSKAFPWMRLAAAAAIAGIIVLGIVMWMDGNNDGSENKELVKTKVPASNNEIAEPGKIITPGNNTEKENLDASENSSVAITDPIKNTPTRKTRNSYSISNRIDATQAIYAYNEHTPNLADRYIMLMTPNGIVRMSKKLGNLVCCVSGEEQDEDCKDQLKTWQEKLATSPATSTGNFMDILSLVSSLENEL